MRSHLILGDLALLEQLLHQGMVAGAGRQLAAMKQVQARIPDMGPVGMVALHHASHAGSTGMLAQAMRQDIIADSLMRLVKGVEQEAERIL